MDEAVVQVCDEAQQQWKTARFAQMDLKVVQTIPLDLKAVTRLRFVPWSNYYRNFRITEIEVR